MAETRKSPYVICKAKRTKNEESIISCMVISGPPCFHQNSEPKRLFFYLIELSPIYLNIATTNTNWKM